MARQHHGFSGVPIIGSSLTPLPVFIGARSVGQLNRPLICDPTRSATCEISLTQLSTFGVRLHCRSIQIYAKLGPIQRQIGLLPGPVKAISCIGLAAGLIFIAGPILLIVGPPLGLAAFWYFRRLRSKRAELYKQRWSSMGSYHLTFDETIKPRDRIPRSVRSRVMSAINKNQDGIASAMGIDESFRSIASEIKFTDVEGIEQEFKGSNTGFQEQMTVSTFGVVEINTGNRLATIEVVSMKKNDGPEKMRIEVVTDGLPPRRFVLEDTKEEEGVLEVKGRRLRDVEQR